MSRIEKPCDHLHEPDMLLETMAHDDPKTGARYMSVYVRARCGGCGLPFKFPGVSNDITFTAPAVDPGGHEIMLPIVIDPHGPAWTDEQEARLASF